MSYNINHIAKIILDINYHCDVFQSIWFGSYAGYNFIKSDFDNITELTI